MSKILSIGFDIGSTTIKLIVINEYREVIWKSIEPVSPYIKKQIENYKEKISSLFGYYDETYIVSTGYGRNLVENSNFYLTEITCHSLGVYYEFERDGTVLDIGGQDCKAIIIDKNGSVIDFIMNDKCSAGTGRFLENIAYRLNFSIEELGYKANSVNFEEKIFSSCTVFAETEIISHLSQGKHVCAILRGVHRALVKRIVAMIKRIGYYPPLILSGGVSLNPTLREMIAEEYKGEVLLSKQPQFTAALGAALLGLQLKNKV